MKIINFGTLYIGEKYKKELFDLMVKEYGNDCIFCDNYDSEINVREVYGDMCSGLQKIANYFKEKGVTLNGTIIYYGEWDGYTVVKNNVVRDYDHEEYGANSALEGNSIGLELKEKLLFELENFKGNNSIETMKKLINEAKTAD